jgi:drug/metabolite transporter (DMT)-like permease
LYFGRFCRGVPLLAGATAQFLSAAVVAARAAGLLETPIAHFGRAALAAVTWNTVMVSLGGMALYFRVLKGASAARATANFYLVPGTAVPAWAPLGERLSPPAFAGLRLASAGCWLVSADAGGAA